MNLSFNEVEKKFQMWQDILSPFFRFSPQCCSQFSTTQKNH